MSLILHLVLLCYQITPVIIITAAILWTGLSNGLNATDTFTALAFVTMTALPMAKLLAAYPKFMSILGCFKRIEAYLLLEERLDSRVVIDNHKSRGSEKDESEKDLSNCSTLETSQVANEPCIPHAPVVFWNASIAPPGKGPILKGVNISVAHSTLVMVLGRTGSGKSTFLRAIVGEANLTDGAIYIEQRQIAYCDQASWLKGLSIRENIIGERSYDADWYETVLNACLLIEDIRQLPHGDQTMSGDGGSNLSGGQRQRIVRHNPF